MKKFINEKADINNPKWNNLIHREKEIYKRENDLRSDFERDYNRILHSNAYKRMKHKTQVFFSPTSDHICTRMEHVSHVDSISYTISNTLGLNTELTKAISIGHDLGHAPFGHQGERILSEISKKYIGDSFWHEKNGVNIVDNIELLDTSSKDGHRIYIRGILYIMAKALNEVYPEALLSVNYQLSSAMFCKIDNMEITDEMIANVKTRMQEIINQNLEIRKVVMTKEEAEEFYSNEKTLRGIVQIDNTQKEGVSLYYCEDYFNYFFGVMPVTTAYTDVFDVIKYGDGFLVRYPSAEKPNELTNYKSNKKLLSTLEEYEDIHRVLQIDTLYKLNKEITNAKW